MNHYQIASVDTVKRLQLNIGLRREKSELIAAILLFHIEQSPMLAILQRNIYKIFIIGIKHTHILSLI